MKFIPLPHNPDIPLSDLKNGQFAVITSEWNHGDLVLRLRGEIIRPHSVNVHALPE